MYFSYSIDSLFNAIGLCRLPRKRIWGSRWLDEDVGMPKLDILARIKWHCHFPGEFKRSHIIYFTCLTGLFLYCRDLQTGKHHSLAVREEDLWRSPPCYSPSKLGSVAAQNKCKSFILYCRSTYTCVHIFMNTCIITSIILVLNIYILIDI